MISRPSAMQSVRSALAANPVCALLGPRQCGKTTLALELARGRRSHYFDLETATGRARMARPELTLAPLSGLVIIDEIQRQPELFTALRPLADRPRSRTRFLILGSASPELVRGASESLAGRLGFVHLGPLDLNEVAKGRPASPSRRDATMQRLWLRGGFPRSYLARTDALSLQWRRDFIRTFLERDIPLLGIRIPSETLRRFWLMIAHYHAQIWNGAELARALGVTEHTVRHYLDLLTGTYLLRQLPPWFENLGKRQFKSPKVYVRDAGLLHALLGIPARADLEGHPKFGASWEGFALEQLLSVAGTDQAYYWGTHSGAELDLMLIHRGRRYGVEFKAAAAPTMTRSLHIALGDLGLERAWIVYPGRESYLVHERIEAIPLESLVARLVRNLR
jgi:predicted AAA+ superfamily ATPase